MNCQKEYINIHSDSNIKSQDFEQYLKWNQSCTHKNPGKPLCSQLFCFKSTEVKESNEE